MKISIDTEARTLWADGRQLPLYSPEAFEVLSSQWVKVGWDLKYVYRYTWLGVPILQLPEDMIRIQEVIWQLRPDVIVETGVARGGSLIFYASLCRAMGHGCVIGVEKGVRTDTREALERHALSDLIMLIEGDSKDPDVVARVRRACRDESRAERVMVILDSNHSKAHVAAELAAYSGLVTVGSYIVACDGNMCDLADTTRGHADWKWNNPQEAAREFAAANPEFVIEQPALPFNESPLSGGITYWPAAWLRRTLKEPSHARHHQ